MFSVCQHVVRLFHNILREWIAASKTPLYNSSLDSNQNIALLAGVKIHAIPMVGLELTRHFWQQILSLRCLPFPPHRHFGIRVKCSLLGLNQGPSSYELDALTNWAKGTKIEIMCHVSKTKRTGVYSNISRRRRLSFVSISGYDWRLIFRIRMIVKNDVLRNDNLGS